MTKRKAKAPKKGLRNNGQTAQPEAEAEPVVTLLIADLVMMAGTHALKKFVDKKIVQGYRDREELQDTIDNSDEVQRVTSSTLSKVAKRSAPGAVLIGAGLAAKFLFEKSEQRRGNRPALPKANSNSDETVDETLDELSE